jgi:hypothetical protein
MVLAVPLCQSQAHKHFTFDSGPVFIRARPRHLEAAPKLGVEKGVDLNKIGVNPTFSPLVGTRLRFVRVHRFGEPNMCTLGVISPDHLPRLGNASQARMSILLPICALFSQRELHRKIPDDDPVVIWGKGEEPECETHLKLVGFNVG